MGNQPSVLAKQNHLGIRGDLELLHHLRKGLEANIYAGDRTAFSETSGKRHTQFSISEKDVGVAPHRCLAFHGLRIPVALTRIVGSIPLSGVEQLQIMGVEQDQFADRLVLLKIDALHSPPGPFRGFKHLSVSVIPQPAKLKKIAILIPYIN